MEDFERLESQRLITIDCAEAMAALREAGIEVENESQQLIEIAKANSTTPKALAEVIVGVAKPRKPGAGDAGAGMESGPFVKPYSGLGRLTLRQYAEKYDANIELALAILAGRGVDLDPDVKLRDEADRLRADPEQIILWLNGEREKGESDGAPGAPVLLRFTRLTTRTPARHSL